MGMSSAEAAVPWVDAQGVEYWDHTGIDDLETKGLVRAKMREIAKSLESWSASTKDVGFDVFTAPTDNPYSVFRACQNAMRDDVVSGIEESVRALSLQGLRFTDPDRPGVAVMLERWAEEVHLHDALNEMLRELFMYQQTVVAIEWGTVRIKESQSASARKTVGMTLPKRITTLDPLCVVPYSAGIFGDWKLAWHLSGAKAIEMRSMGQSVTDGIFDGWVDRSEVSMEEQSRLARMGVDVQNLVRLREDQVFRIREVNNSYDRFGEVALRTVFPMLSLKGELMKSDSVGLRGTANYILLVKQGSDERPAAQAEIDALRENFRSLARVPIVVSDHRLSVEILTPNVQYTLDPKRYDLLDRRLASRMLRSNDIEGAGDGDAAGQLRSRTIAETLSSRRERLRRFISSLIREENPSGAVRMEFIPSRVVVDNGSLFANLMQNARDRRIISRQSALEHLGLSQDVEAARIQAEEKEYGDIFDEQVPFNSPENGRPDGGGDASRNEATPKSGNGGTKKEQK